MPFFQISKEKFFKIFETSPATGEGRGLLHRPPSRPVITLNSMNFFLCTPLLALERVRTRVCQGYNYEMVLVYEERKKILHELPITKKLF